MEMAEPSPPSYVSVCIFSVIIVIVVGVVEICVERIAGIVPCSALFAVRVLVQLATATVFFSVKLFVFVLKLP